MKGIVKVSKKQALAAAFVCYLCFTVSVWGFPDASVQARAMAAWNEIIKAIDPKTQIKTPNSYDDFANY